jgi:hypothetical protein
VENLFRYESRFDSPALRDAIGRLLAGAYEGALNENDVKIRNLTREFDAKNGELRSLISVAGGTEHSLTLEWLDGERSETSDFEQWEKGDVKDAAVLMKPAPENVLQRWPVSRRVNSSKAPTDHASLIVIEGDVATSDEIMAATMSYARELGQFGAP